MNTPFNNFKMSLKRKRSINFTREETDVLIKLVEEYKHVIENKKSDAETWNEKERCWKTIEACFNFASGVTYRSAKTLRLKYEGIKRDIRKKAIHSQSLTPNEEKVKQMMSATADGVESSFDPDHIPSVTVDDPLSNDVGNMAEMEEMEELETESDECSWKQHTSLMNESHPALCDPKSKWLFDKITQEKLAVTEIQRRTLEMELINKRKKWYFEAKEREQQRIRWEFEEEERKHKREMWELEKQMMTKKLNS